MKTLFSYFQQFSLPKVRKTRLQADFVTNNQILVEKIIKNRLPLLFPLLFRLNFLDGVNKTILKKQQECQNLLKLRHLKPNQLLDDRDGANEILLGRKQQCQNALILKHSCQNQISCLIIES